jgi:ferredoxin
MPKVTVHNVETGEVKTFKAGVGANLRQAAHYAGVELYKGMNKLMNCRGMGVCGTCLIEVEPKEHAGDPSFIEKLHRIQPNQKLGCRAKIWGDLVIKVALKD